MRTAIQTNRELGRGCYGAKCDISRRADAEILLAVRADNPETADIAACGSAGEAEIDRARAVRKGKKGAVIDTRTIYTNDGNRIAVRGALEKAFPSVKAGATDVQASAR